MFVDHKSSLVNPPAATPSPAPLSTPPSRKTMFIAIVSAAVVVIGIAAWWYLSRPKEQAPVQNQPTENQPTGLPETLEPTGNENETSTGQGNDFKGETVTFDAFYKSLSDETLDMKAKGVTLPLNVKSQVSNYYEVARKLNIDGAVNDLNKNGFAVIDNQLGAVGNDFFSAYAELNRRGIPFLVTEDFLLYYYQTSLQQIYDEVKASYFYDSLWKVNKELFEAANVRYQERRQKIGITNDPLLEGERLEAGYFAMALTLLSPDEGQVNISEELTATRTFKPSEAKKYQFTPPAYLADDINEELALIAAAKQSAKSPLFLYARDYGEFKVPVEYADNAKLKNYFLASRWQSSLFPLDYKTVDCPNCLLDRDDWTINQIAAYLLAEDLSSRQPLKNEWAKIYKVTAFFSGLRSDLTYLDYQSARNALFPKKSAEDIFGRDARTQLAALTKELDKKSFTPAAGGLSRTDKAQRPALGLRLLQTAFWPDRFIYDRLTYAPVGNHNQPRNARNGFNQYLTACTNGKAGVLYRCRGIGFDILGAISPVKPASAFITSNINYQRYASEREKLQKDIKGLSGGTLHGSNFWSTLETAGALTDETLENLPYTASPAWTDRKLTTGLASLTQLALPADTWEVSRTTGTSLSTVEDKSLLSYVEPNRALADRLVAQADMIFKTLSALGVVRDNDPRFSELLGRLQSLRQVARTELSGGKLSADTYQMLNDVVGQYKTVRAGAKIATVSFNDTSTQRTMSVKQSIAPLKLLLLIYNKDGQNVLVAGPVFSYKEE